MYCLHTKRADWSFRLLQELKDCTSAFFLTLTYAVDPVSLVKKDLQLFFKRLRKFNSGKIRYYAVGEYGTKTGRPHYHAIVFGLDLMKMNDLIRLWSHGSVYVGNVSPASIAYTTKYVINRVGSYPGRDPPFALMSRRPGIGGNYLVRMRGWHKDDMRMYVLDGGLKKRLPRFYKDKIFTKMEKQISALYYQPQGIADYLEEIERLSFLHPDPGAYYDERIARNHELLFVNLNDKNIF